MDDNVFVGARDLRKGEGAEAGVEGNEETVSFGATICFLFRFLCICTDCTLTLRCVVLSPV